MPLISDNYHKNKLKQFGINIKTMYIVGNKILQRNTDDSYNDDINRGIRCEKQYFVKNQLVHTENEFDSRIEYTFISQDNEKKDYTCPNCGYHSILIEFIEGCPYCGTYYNIDYTNKDLGSKYHYDRVLRNNAYKVITGVVDLIVCLIFCFIIIKLTSRTFNSYDLLKVFFYACIAAGIFYYLFYIVDATVILEPIKKYKDKQNKKQIEFWKRTGIDKKVFFNNLNHEIRKLYYSNEFIIDYDMIDYIRFKDFEINNKLCVEVVAEVRVVTYKNGNVKSKYKTETFVLMKHGNGSLELKDGVNIIKCGNCGASIDVIKGKCEFCDTKVEYLQEWILVK